MSETPVLEYELRINFSDEKNDHLFEKMTYFGLGSAVDRDDGTSRVTFMFGCGCEGCPDPRTIEEARGAVEPAMRALGVEFDLVGSEMMSNDVDE